MGGWVKPYFMPLQTLEFCRIMYSDLFILVLDSVELLG